MKAVLFDLGKTLIKTAPVHEIFGRILSAHGIQVPTAEIHSALAEVDGQMRLEDYRLPYNDFWRLYNMRILKRLGVTENLEELADAVTDEWWDNAGLELYPDVGETLRRLKKMNLKIGIVTNGLQADIEEVLSRTGLTGEFDVMVGVDDVGKPKPYGEIFSYALRRIGVRPQETLFVGDNPETDYEGAEDAGLNALLIDRDEEISGPVRKIRDLRDVARYV